MRDINSLDIIPIWNDIGSKFRYTKLYATDYRMPYPIDYWRKRKK